ncbi:MAG: hypothetical protein EPO19_11065 [Betaproteobacteria bacterium]|nr:MAG: hypothetical protein EPO19_11065 [Betaproteobacteria bacterium]
MAKRPPNHGKPWSDAQVAQLERLAAGNTPTRVIALHMGRTPEAVYAAATRNDVDLSPTNQSPYGPRRK